MLGKNSSILAEISSFKKSVLPSVICSNKKSLKPPPKVGSK